MKVTVSYQTLQLPPPFAYAYTLDLYIDGDQVKVKFAQEYLNRDTLSEEEILNEGFTTSDDFSWEGILGKVWADYLSAIFEEVRLQEVNEEENLWIHFAFASRAGLVSDVQYWDYELQEILQAIYEASAREEKMKLGFLFIEDSNQKSRMLISSFEKRTAWIEDRAISWEEFRKTINIIYNYDFTHEGKKKPVNIGLWVDVDGSGIYYLVEEKLPRNELLELVF